MLKAKTPEHIAFAKALEAHLEDLPEKHALTLEGAGTSSLAAWFLGPKAENEQLLAELIAEAVARHCQDRRTYYPDDPPYVTEKMKSSREYKRSVADFRRHLDVLLKRLQGSVPFFSYRYQAHMNWDITMPGVLGYFATMLYNPNNVAAEASPVTTPLEMEVGDDLCEMLGYKIPGPNSKAIRPWGHITCDGSVANLEAMWASRNLKYYTAALAAAIKQEPELKPALGMTISLPTGGRGVIVELDSWQLLNLLPDDVLDLPTRMQDEYGISTDTLSDLMNGYSIQNLGFQDFHSRFLPGVPTAVMFGPSTMHYSWPKAAAVLGLGMNNLLDVHVDLDGRMEVSHLRDRLDECLTKKVPVIMTVAVIGSTEESAVDPLSDVISLRDEYAKKGLVFTVHSDAAWGGYFACLLRPGPQGADVVSSALAGRQFTPEMSMSPYVNKQYRALGDCDSITVDPHKAGYIPYPAGGLCYRNGSMRYLVAFTAPVVYHGGVDPTVGVYGIEGSKPGAAAGGVFLSHRVIRTNRSGYGKILGQSLFNSKRLYSALVTMATDEDPFIIVPFNRLPAEKKGEPPPKVRAQLEYIRRNIVPKTNDELLADPEAMKLFRQLGSDQIIVAYAFNFKRDGVLNKDVTLLNNLNNAIYTALSLSPQDDKRHPPLIVTSSDFEPAVYGAAFMDSFKGRLGVQGDDSSQIAFLLSTTQDPWVTDTSEGNFIPVLIEALRGAVLQAIKQVEQAGTAAAPSKRVSAASSRAGKRSPRR